MVLYAHEFSWCTDLYVYLCIPLLYRSPLLSEEHVTTRNGNWSVLKMCRRHCTEIALLVLNIGLCAVLVWLTHSQIQLNQLQHEEAQLPNELRQLEESTTAKISELEESLKEELRGAKGKISELEDEVRQLQKDLDTIQTTKANQSELDHLSNTVSVLSQTKVNMTEFNSLLSNVSILRETVATRADKDIVLDLTADMHTLRATSLNESHYDQLQSGIDMLKGSKVNWTDFEDLVLNVTSLADSTVRTSDFLQFSKTVTDLESTTHENISLLRLNFTNEIGYINTALTGKAEQHDVDMLTERVTTLSDTTKTLNENVQSLTNSKADQTNLKQLKATVNRLDDATAKQKDLHRLDEKVSNHISSSQQTHSQHDSRISGNGGDIRSNTARITSDESDIKQLKDSTPGLTASWMIASTTVSLILVYMY